MLQHHAVGGEGAEDVSAKEPPPLLPEEEQELADAEKATESSSSSEATPSRKQTASGQEGVTTIEGKSEPENQQKYGALFCG